MIQVFSPSLDSEELANIADSFNTGWIGKGPKVAEFERAWAQHIGVNPENVVSVNCATEGLFQVMDLIRPDKFGISNIGPVGQVIIPSVHFIGAAQAIISVGGRLTFCDVDKHTLNPTLEHIQARYTRHAEAVCLLHYGGVAQELDAIRQWCDDKHIWLIEDAACSPATVYKGKAAGTWGHFGVWSFDAMKIMTTGDGGMIYCENPEHAKRLRKHLYLGMNSESGLLSQNERWWEFGVSGMGRRAIMNDLAAGMGLEQLKKLDGFVLRRGTIDIIYTTRLKDTDIFIPTTLDTPDCLSSAYLYWIQTPRRDDLAKFLRANDIYSTFRYYPLHRVFKTGDNLPGVDYAADNTLLLPLHCNLTDEQVNFVCTKVKEFYDH